MKKFFIFLAALLPVAAFALAAAGEGEDAAAEETTISIGSSTLRIMVNDSTALTATITPEASEGLPVTWETTNPEIATVNEDGVLVGVGIGEVTVSATVCDTISATRKVIVGLGTSNNPSYTLTVGEPSTPALGLAEGMAGSVAWTTSNEAIATVDQNGCVEVLGIGARVTITATRTFADESTYSAKYYVKGTWAEEYNNATLLVGQTIQLPGNLEGATSWSTGNAEVATVETGLVTAVGLGTAKITAKGSGSGASSVTCTVNVVEPFYLTQTSLSLQLADVAQLEPVFFPADTATDITWTSSDEAVATVANGLVTATGMGECTITATAGGNTAECAISVGSPVNISSEALEIPVGSEAQAPISIADAYANGNVAVWTSSDPSVASVGAVGRNATVRGLSVGQATISVKCGEFESSFPVTVKKMVYNQVKTELLLKDYSTYKYDDPTTSKMPFIVSYYGSEDGFGTLHFQSEDPDCGMDFYYEIVNTGKTKRALQGGKGLEVYGTEVTPMYDNDMLISDTDAYFEWNCDSITYYDSYIYFMGGTGYSWVYNSNDLTEENKAKYLGGKDVSMILLRPYVYYRENSLDDELVSSWRYYSTVMFIDNEALYADHGNAIPEEYLPSTGNTGGSTELAEGEGNGAVVLAPWTVANFNKLGTYSDVQPVTIQRTGEGQYTIKDFMYSGSDLSFSLTNANWENLVITEETADVKTDATLGGLYLQGGYSFAPENLSATTGNYVYLMTTDGDYLGMKPYGYHAIDDPDATGDSETQTDLKYTYVYRPCENQNYCRAYAEPVEFLGNYGDATPYKYQLRIYAQWYENGGWAPSKQGVYVYFNDIDGIYVAPAPEGNDGEDHNGDYEQDITIYLRDAAGDDVADAQKTFVTVNTENDENVYTIYNFMGSGAPLSFTMGSTEGLTDSNKFAINLTGDNIVEDSGYYYLLTEEGVDANPVISGYGDNPSNGFYYLGFDSLTMDGYLWYGEKFPGQPNYIRINFFTADAAGNYEYFYADFWMGDLEPLVIVEPTPIIELDRTHLYFIPGQEASIEAVVTNIQVPFEDEENVQEIEFTWTSSNEEVATVENGVVTAVAAGTAVISAAYLDGVAYCEVEVDPAPEYPEMEGYKYQTWSLTGESAYDVIATDKVAVKYDGDPDGRGVWTLNIKGYEASFRIVESELEDADVIEPVMGFTEDDAWPVGYYLSYGFDWDDAYASWFMYGNGYRNWLDYIFIYSNPEEYWTTADLDWTKETARVNFYISWWPFDWTTEEFAEVDELGYLLLDINKADFGIDTLWTGVESMATDNEKAEYFNLQGVRVANPDKGIYIVRKGNKTTKVAK